MRQFFIEHECRSPYFAEINESSLSTFQQSNLRYYSTCFAAELAQ